MNISLYTPLSIHEIGQRDNQEDSLWPLHVSSEDRFFVLCDGMGGHEHGEVASQTVTHALGEWYCNCAVRPIDKFQIEDALNYAYVQLDQKDCDEFRKMGTTLTLLYIGDNGVLAAHIGDSRIYHVRPQIGILYQSRDHSLAYDLFQSGEITFEEMINFKQKNIVTRAMTPGEENRMRPDIIQITDIKSGDYFYICSDGMLENMTNNDLFAILSSSKTDEEKRQLFISSTVNNSDNHTAWLIHVLDVVGEDSDKNLINEESTARCNIINIMPSNKLKDELVNSGDSDDDVVVVHSSYSTFNMLKIIIAISVIFIVVVVGIILLRPVNNQSKESEELMMRTPIKHNQGINNSKDTTVEDSNIVKKHE